MRDENKSTALQGPGMPGPQLSRKHPLAVLLRAAHVRPLPGGFLFSPWGENSTFFIIYYLLSLI